MTHLNKKYWIRRLAYYAHLVGMCAISIVAISAFFIPESPTFQKADTWALVIFLFIALVGVYTFVAMPQYVEVTSDGKLNFWSYLGARELSPNDLKEISTESMGYYVIFRFNNTKYKFLNRIDGLYELLSYLKELNPNVTLKGL